MLKSSFQRLIVISGIGILLSACGAPSILIKPPADKIEKIALVHVYANRGVRNMEGASKFGALTALASMASSSEKKGGVDFGGARLTSYAVDTFNDEFAKVGKWKIVKTAEVVGSKAYKDFAQRSQEAVPQNAAVKALIATGTVLPDNMQYLPGEGRDQDSKRSLTQLAQELGVDAVAVLEMDVAYTPSTAIGGTGTASAAVGVSLAVITKYGDYAVKLPKVQGEKSYSPYRQRSDGTTAMLGGEIAYAAAEDIFQESIKKDIVALRDQINNELTGKK
ncbi:MAG: hypothetical protein OEW08_12635 [Gammaproteobacteria bacterium]|nr:hypothetical protein [Gammaproteobacteria bacterium]